MKTYLHGSIDYTETLHAETLKSFRVGDLDQPDIRKRYTSSRVEEKEGAQSCPCDIADESRAHIVGECELYKGERNMLEEDMTKIDGYDMDKFGAFGSSEKTIAILLIGGDHRRPKRKEIRAVKIEGQKFEILEDPSQTLPDWSPMSPVW